LRFRYAFARVLDANRKFLDAAQRYYEVSTPQLGVSIPENEIVEAFANAIVCAVLGKSGAQRNRIISLLYKVQQDVDLDVFFQIWLNIECAQFVIGFSSARI
jgi:COP9 signalosome complex subunit 4